MNGVIYARYSSDSQREESIEGQIRECREYAKKNDIQIVEIYIDRALSAKTDNRPEFQRVIKDSGNQLFEVVLVWKLDRFARNRFDSAHYKRILKKNGVRVLSATEVISKGSEGILLESILEGYAEYYSAELAEKVIRGMTENAYKCKYNGGTLPLGYKIDSEKHFILDPIAVPAVQEAFVQYSEGATMQEVANELNRKGMCVIWGRAFDGDAVRRLLHNRLYIGEYKFRDITIEKGIPCIVEKELFDKVQDLMKINKKAPARRKAEDEYLLTTKLFCGNCQNLMVGECGTSRTLEVHRYYKCTSAKRRQGCTKKAVRKQWIEELVIENILKLIFDDGIIDRAADMVIEFLNEENTVLPMLKKQYAEVQRKIGNMLKAIQQGIITETTKKCMEDLEDEKSRLAVEMVKEEMRRPTLTKEQIVCWLKHFRKYNPNQLAHRRILINSFVNAVFLYDDRVVMTFSCSKDAKTITFADLEASNLGSNFSASRPPYKNADIDTVSIFISVLVLCLNCLYLRAFFVSTLYRSFRLYEKRTCRLCKFTLFHTLAERLPTRGCVLLRGGTNNKHFRHKNTSSWKYGRFSVKRLCIYYSRLC